jgi:hypothetical protein
MQICQLDFLYRAIEAHARTAASGEAHSITKLVSSTLFKLFSKIFVALAALYLGFPGASNARDVTDSAGRKVQIPDRIDRAMAAGPPASALLSAGPGKDDWLEPKTARGGPA